MRTTSRRLAAALVGIGVACLFPALASAQARAAGGRLDGVVYDSVARRPLAGATVQLVTPDYGDSRAVITDLQGRFRLDSLAPGAWIVGALHPRLDSLGIAQLSRGVTITARGTTRITLGVPSTTALITRTCGAAAAADSGGYVRGTLRDVAGHARGGTVWLAWQEVLLGGDGRAEHANSGIEATVDSTGRFLACGVPAGALVYARGWRGADSTGLLELRTPDTGIGVLDLVIGANVVRTLPAPVAPDDSTTATPRSVLRGPGRLEGVARATTGQPVAGARVTVWGTGLDTRTDAEGRFVLQELPLGSFTLDARAVGYDPQRQTVTMVPDSATRPTLVFERNVMLDTLKVRATGAAAVDQTLADFADRRRRNATRARFFGPEELERLNPLQISDVFIQVPGVRAQSNGQVLMRGAVFAQWCTPVVFIDGARLERVGRLENLVNAQYVRAVEVYPSANSAPQQFSGGMSSCGVIVIWTGVRQW